MGKLSLIVLNVDGGIDGIFRALRADVHQDVLVISHRCRVIHLVETHNVRDDLLIYVGLPVALDQVHQDADCAPSLVTENLTCRDVICRHDISWLVLLHFTKCGTCLLELSVKDVHESRIEAHKHSDCRSRLIN